MRKSTFHYALIWIAITDKKYIESNAAIDFIGIWTRHLERYSQEPNDD